MELKNGYKMSEVGVIPVDWEVAILNDLSIKIGSGITPTGGETVYKKDGRPLVRSQNIGWGRLLLDDIAYIDDETHQTFPNTEIKINDVFLNISGASIGRSSYANEKLVGGNVNQHVCIIRTIDKKLQPLFLNLFLLSKNGQKQIDSFQSGGNRQGLNIGQIKTFQIPLPSTIEEQTAIATALTEADALISGIEKLIAKKRDIKQGVMQKLLSPTEGWVVKCLKDITTLITKGTTPKTFSDSGINYIKIESLQGDKINIEKCLFIDEDTNKNELKRSILNEGDLLFAIAGATIGKCTIVPKEIIPANTNQALSIIRLKEDTSKMLVFYFLKSTLMQKYVVDNIAGGAQPNLNLEQIGRFSFSLPPTIEEQTRIATILSDMDAEIAVLEKKLEKYRAVKAGMMQNLLTGKIRLV